MSSASVACTARGWIFARMLDRRLTNGKLKKFILGIIILTFLIGFIYNTAAPRKYVESTSDFGLYQLLNLFSIVLLFIYYFLTI